MSYSRVYSRLFITLKQERPDYCLDFRPTMGRSLIEIKNNKGKLNVYAQGLKPNIFYKVFLISVKDNKSIGVPIGFIDIDNNGKGELKYNFEPDNVAQSNLPIDDFNVMAILVQGQQEIKAPLVGYTESAVLWKNNFSILDKEDRKLDSDDLVQKDKELDNNNLVQKDKELDNNDLVQKDKKLDSNDLVQKDKKLDNNNSVQKDEKLDNNDLVQKDEKLDNNDLMQKDKKSDSNNSVQKNEKSSNSDLAQKEKKLDNNINYKTAGEKDNKKINLEINNNKNINYNSETVDNTNNTEEELSNDKIKIMVEKFKRDIDELKYYATMDEKEAKINNNMIKEKINKNFSDIDYIFKRNKSVTPFLNDKNNIRWIRASLKELSIINNNVWKYINNPFIVCNYRRYGHILIGRDKNDNFILGVPSRYNPSYKLEASVQGFKKFRCYDDKAPMLNDYGYWIMLIED